MFSKGLVSKILIQEMELVNVFPPFFGEHFDAHLCTIKGMLHRLIKHQSVAWVIDNRGMEGR